MHTGGHFQSSISGKVARDENLNSLNFQRVKTEISRGLRTVRKTETWPASGPSHGGICCKQKVRWDWISSQWSCKRVVVRCRFLRSSSALNTFQLRVFHTRLVRLNLWEAKLTIQKWTPNRINGTLNFTTSCRGTPWGLQWCFYYTLGVFFKSLQRDSVFFLPLSMVLKQSCAWPNQTRTKGFWSLNPYFIAHFISFVCCPHLNRPKKCVVYCSTDDPEWSKHLPTLWSWAPHGDQ